MLIWDYIRDFLVQYIFGGVTSDGSYYYGSVGFGPTFDENGNFFDALQYDTNNYLVSIGVSDGSNKSTYTSYIGLGDWLSTTCTIVIMVAIVILFALLVRWVYRAVTSAFLLR